MRASQVNRFVRCIKCATGHHKYIVVQELTGNSRRIACLHCRRSWGMNDSVRAVLPWDYELAGCYSAMGVQLRYLPWERLKPNDQVDAPSGATAERR